jgi:hypothetical protein
MEKMGVRRVFREGRRPQTDRITYRRVYYPKVPEGPGRGENAGAAEEGEMSSSISSILHSALGGLAVLQALKWRPDQLIMICCVVLMHHGPATAFFYSILIIINYSILIIINPLNLTRTSCQQQELHRPSNSQVFGCPRHCPLLPMEPTQQRINK